MCAAEASLQRCLLMQNVLTLHDSPPPVHTVWHKNLQLRVCFLSTSRYLMLVSEECGFLGRPHHHQTSATLGRMWLSAMHGASNVMYTHKQDAGFTPVSRYRPMPEALHVPRSRTSHINLDLLLDPGWSPCFVSYQHSSINFLFLFSRPSLLHPGTVQAL